MKLTLMRRGNGGTYHLRKSVPKRYHGIESRREVWISLKTDSDSEARRRADAVWQETLAVWEAMKAGDTTHAEARFQAARDLAQALGFRYKTARQVPQAPMSEIVKRVEAIPDRRGRPDMKIAAALLGNITPPATTITKALEQFWDLAQDRTLGKSADQIRRWRNPRLKAVANFVKVVGDKPIADITQDDMLDFVDWWMGRIRAEGLTPNSANKDITHLSNILKTVNTKKRMGLKLPLGDLALREGEKRTRPPFSYEWIRDKILAPGALDGLNHEARCILLGMVNTGYRPSEGAGLLREHIRLDATIPHISIEPVGRTLKSQYARRVIPLAGVSLAAFRECPDGFPRYRDNAGLSDTINKFLRENRLLETPGHSLYSLRHSFEDRMLEAEVDERIRRDLFGHALNRERHGKGASLEHKARVIEAIAL
ncbi:MAG: integrase [Rhodobacteraceae bacterium]|jgi:integrase|nr:integrase [Paracoccaceae bacterium]